VAKAQRQLAMTVGDRGRFTLSEEVRKHLGVAEGDTVLIELTEQGTVEMVAAALIPRDQVWFAHPAVQARVSAAHADIVAGRTTRVAKGSELRTRLDKLKKARRAD